VVSIKFEQKQLSVSFLITLSASFKNIARCAILAQNPQNLKCQIKISTPKTIFDRSTGKNTSVCVLYIGKLGDGSSPDDGIYILLKEVLDNCIDEFVMGAGKTIEVTIRDKTVNVRDYGRNSSWESH
jgi:topoisomerase-4 subunit B